jgi:hypothetical protein
MILIWKKIYKEYIMNKTLSLLAAISLLFTNCGPVVYTSATNYPAASHTQTSMGFEVFYNELAPYGRWMDYPGEGYVWVPNVEQGFRPYATNGHWVYSDHGWTWASNYQWGWAAFHYGRWMYEDAYGWIWVPGHEWAPAWVTWGQSGGYYGWAPLAPHISINMSVGGGWNPPAHYWNFVPQEHITQTNVNNYVINNTNNTTIVNNISKNITYINNSNINTNISNTTISNTNITNNNISNRNFNNSNVTNNNVTNNNPNTAIRNNNIPNYNVPSNNQIRNTNQSQVIYNRGPQVHDVEKSTNNPINQMIIHETDRPNITHPNEEHRMDLYRPQVASPNMNIPAQSRPAPIKVERYQPPANRNINPQKGNNRGDERKD